MEDSLDTRSPLARAVHALAYGSGLAPRWARRAGQARIVMLHGVGPRGLPAAALEAQLRWLSRHFRILPLADLVDMLETGRPFEGDEVALTFDDGLANHAEIAAPLLAQCQAPATFFVCPGLLESRTWLWNHEVRARLAGVAAAARPGLRKALGPDAPLDTSDASLVGWMKTLAPTERGAAEDVVRAATPAFAAEEALAKAYDPMSVEALRALDPTWITVGSHTLTHPILPTVDDARLAAELAKSRAQLEALLDREVDLFCYPDGGVDARVARETARHYRAAVTTRPATVAPDADPHLLPRVGSVENPAEFAWRLVRP